MNTKLLLGLVAVISLVVGLAGCSRGSEDSTRVGHWSLSTPEGWVETTPSDPKVWQKAYEVDGTRIEFNGQALERDSVTTPLNTAGLSASMQLADYRAGNAVDLQIDGADRARQLEYTFTDGGKARAGLWIAASKGGEKPAAALISVSSAQGQVDRAVVDELLGALKWV